MTKMSNNTSANANARQDQYKEALELIRNYKGVPDIGNIPRGDLDINRDDPEAFYWIPQPGPQMLTAASRADETYTGGSRGGGKSFAVTMKIVEPAVERHNGRARYPNYAGLALRVAYVDLEDWLNTAKNIYTKLGVIATGSRPTTFKAHSGAIIRTGHMANLEDAEKYRGNNNHRIIFDEVNQLADIRAYLHLLGTLRGSPTGQSQIFTTGNPGGQGDHWVHPRFCDVTVNGVPIKPGTLFMDPETGGTRMFIEAKLRDNPALMTRDPKYLLKLLAQDPITRRQWIDGDRTVTQTTFFTEFRKYPFYGEPAHAYHCIHSSRVELKPWYRRWIGLDIGYDDYTIVYWFCQHDDGRVYVYREYAARRTSPYQLGVDIANLSLQDLDTSDSAVSDAISLPMYCSPDLFRNVPDGQTRATQLADGINSVLGRGSAVAMGLNEDERVVNDTDPGRANELYVARVSSLLQECRIMLRPANNNRVEGWSYIREMLRWVPTADIGPMNAAFDQVLRSGSLKGAALRRRIEVLSQPDKALPKCRIFIDKCPRLIHALERAQTLETELKSKKNDIAPHKDIDDALDAFRYGILGFMYLEKELPKAYWSQKLLADAKARGADLNALHMMHITQEQNWEKMQKRKRQAEALLRNADSDLGSYVISLGPKENENAGIEFIESDF